MVGQFDSCTSEIDTDYVGGDVDTDDVDKFSTEVPATQCCTACLGNVQCGLAIMCGGACFMKTGAPNLERKHKTGCTALRVRDG